MQKMINGGKQLEQHKSKHVGCHWRHFYQLYKEGKLEQEYERVIGSAYYDVFCQNGIIQTDDTIPTFFQNLKKEELSLPSISNK